MARKLIRPAVRLVWWFSAVLLFSVPAAALGTYHLSSNEAQESNGQWHIRLRIDLPRPPSLPHMPMKFLFTEETEYERALTDNSKDPVLNRIPMQNQLPKAESLDVDFADATGKIFKSTFFDFYLSRVRGSEAGEYKMQVRTSDGSDVGGSATIILKGDNPTVDRRSITFTAKTKDTKKDAGTEVAQNDTSAVPTSTEVAAQGTPPPFIPAEGFQKTPEEEKVHGGGCCGGSMIASRAPTSNAAIVALTLGAGVLLHRRRRRK